MEVDEEENKDEIWRRRSLLKGVRNEEKWSINTRSPTDSIFKTLQLN